MIRKFRMAAALAVSCAIVAAPGATRVQAQAQAQVPQPGPFVTLLFSRTEITSAVACTPDDTGVARLDTDVAPYLASLGMTGTGTLETGGISELTETCTHGGGTIMSSWFDAGSLSLLYGWSFVSHTSTYPAHLASQSSDQQRAQTCGSADAIDAHGLRGGHGLIAYPGAQGAPLSVQTTYGEQCFAWGRRYALAVTPFTAGTTAPYWQKTSAVGGGACNDPAAACYSVVSTNVRHYLLPSTLITEVGGLRPGKWMTLQSFILVTGTSPAGSPIQWDCTSPDPTEHWSNDNERYCYSDWQSVVAAIAARSDVTIADPLTVGIAFGRPSTYSQ